MQIRELTAFVVRLPLRQAIVHALAARTASENLVVRCRVADGTTGWGEGVPREYVTGESAAGAMTQLAAVPLSEQLSGDCNNWADVIALCDHFRPAVQAEDVRGCASNALRCAVELAILDAFGRLQREPLSRVVAHFDAAAPIRRSCSEVRYSTTITAQSPVKEAVSALKMRLYGFKQCKVKVGMSCADDAQRLRTIRRILGRGVDIRVDANEAWPAEEAVPQIEALLPAGITCVEQPLPHEALAALADVRRQVPVPIMLDESLASVYDAETAIRLKACDLFNIRLSKCGGFLNSLRLAAMARAAGLAYQVGCHPGESAILSAAGRHFAASVADIRYLEGSYDRHLLRTLITDEDITFGYGGRAPALTAPGLGITVRENLLRPLVVREETFRIEN